MSVAVTVTRWPADTRLGETVSTYGWCSPSALAGAASASEISPVSTNRHVLRP